MLEEEIPTLVVLYTLEESFACPREENCGRANAISPACLDAAVVVLGDIPSVG